MASVEVTITLPIEATPDVGRTFLQLQDEVLAHGFGVRYRPRVKTWLNEALGKLSRQTASTGLELESAIDISPGVRHYSIPGAVTRVIDVRDENGAHLSNVEIAESDTSLGKGAPSTYSLFQGRIVVSPEPLTASTIFVRYRGRPGRLNADSDLTGLPSAYEDLLTHYALWHAYLAEDDPELGNVHKQEWVEGVREFSRDSQLEDESESRQIIGMMPRFWFPQFRRP